MDQGILEVTNYAGKAEMEFHCSTQVKLIQALGCLRCDK